MSPQDDMHRRTLILGVVLVLGLLTAFWLTVQAALQAP